jgi:hypothetical protein
MIVRFREDARDHASLLGYPEALFVAERFDVDAACHRPEL